MAKFRRQRLRFKRESRKRPINVLASCITAFSLYLGLTSIFCAAREDYDKAAYLILAAIVCDMLDGTVARLTKSVSDFGKEFDSLCDLVSFGVAPAVLIYHAYLREEQMAGSRVGRTGAFIAIIYVIFGALRLARYNVFQSTQRESFTGLPIPAAGAAVASLVLFTEYWKLNVTWYVLGPLTLALAVLMISTVRYPKDRLKKAFVVSPRNAFRWLALGGVIIAAFHFPVTHSPAIVLFPLSMGYVLFGPLEGLVLRLRGRGTAAPSAPAPASPETAAAPPGAAAEETNKDEAR